ncbi:hypothetical protein [Bradyrhizobium sp. UFLA05-112]
MTGTTDATMSHAAAMSPGSTNASSYPATCSRTATTTTTAATAAAAASEQWAGRCDQQCRYCSYCKKLCYLRHDDLLFAFNSASSSRLHRRARRQLKVERATNVPYKK